MVLILVRTLVLYIVVLFVMRGMGKREISQMQPYELAISIMIADLAATPMAELGIPIIYGIIPIFGLLTMHILISLINMKSLKLREFICGKPRILIYRGKIDEKALKKENFTINELQERLRGNNITNISDVEYAILETSGEVTVVSKPEKRVVTLEDLNLEAKYQGIPYELVIDGNIMEDNLRKIGKNYNWLKKEIEKFGYKPEDALIVTVDANGDIFSQKKDVK